MTRDELLAMGFLVSKLMAPDSFLFLWAPNAIVLEGTAEEVARYWGFSAKQLISWVKTTKDGKPRIGGGHYRRVCTELLLLCKRGKPRVNRHDVAGVIMAPRAGHSAKPDESYELIEKLVDGPYLELFARRRYSDKWTVWGDEIQ
jgi:N6-adenosine-specific RNA methylase IME4